MRHADARLPVLPNHAVSQTSGPVAECLSLHAIGRSDSSAVRGPRSPARSVELHIRSHRLPEFRIVSALKTLTNAPPAFTSCVLQHLILRPKKVRRSAPRQRQTSARVICNGMASEARERGAWARRRLVDIQERPPNPTHHCTAGSRVFAQVQAPLFCLCSPQYRS